jgi:hypothetical protein
VGILLLRIFGPQLAGLIGYAALRRISRRANPLLPQLAAVLLTAGTAVCAAAPSLEGTARIGAFVVLEIFVALLAQLLIAAAEE